MRFRRLLAFILALTMLAGNVSGAYANDAGTADKEYTGEVSGSNITGSFPFDVSTDDISTDDSIIWDKNPDETSIFEDIISNDLQDDGEEQSVLVGDDGIFEGDISDNDISSNDIITDPDVYEEEEFSSEEAHGTVAGTNEYTLYDSAITNSSYQNYYYDKYYNQIGEPAQAIYNIIFNRLDDFSNPSFTIDVKFSELSGDYAYAESGELKSYCLDGFAAFDYDHPEVFWLRPSSFAFSLLKSASKGTYVGMRIKLASTATSYYQQPYDESPADISADKATMEKYISKIVDKTKQISDFSGKIKLINDELSNLNYYNRYVYKGYKNQATLLAWESTSALSLQPWLTGSSDNGSADAPVCEGYARAFKLICGRLGIPTLVVVGANHMWNYVKDPLGIWYAVDVTWDDPVSRSDGSKEWQTKETPAADIDKYVLVGSETIINGATFASRHPADGAFWRDGNSAFEVPELSETAYSENVVVEDATFFVGARNDADAVITIDEVIGNEEDKYFRAYSDAVSYALELKETYPEKQIIVQLNWDFEFTESVVESLTGTNIILSLRGNHATFLMQNRYSFGTANIRKAADCELIVKLIGNLEIDTDLYDSSETTINLNGYKLTVSEGKTSVFASIYGGNLSLEKNAHIILSKSDSSIVSLEIPSGEDESLYPYLLSTDNANLSIQNGIIVKNGGTGKVNIGVLNSQNMTEDYFSSPDFSDLPLCEGNCILFSTDFIMDYSSVINPISSSENRMEVVFSEGKVFIREIIYHLYAVNEESSTEELIESYSSITSAFAYINTVSNNKKKYNLRLSADGEVEETLEFPDNCALLTINSADGYKLCVNGNIKSKCGVCFDNIILSADNLTSTGKLILKDSHVTLSGNLSVNLLDMEASTVVVAGLVTINSLISRTDSNSILYGNPTTEYINSDGNVNLYKDDVFSKSFDTLQEALNKIEEVGNKTSEFTIRINSDEVGSGSNIVFPSEGKASLIRIVSNGDAKQIRYKNTITINTNVLIENVILRPKYEDTVIIINDYELTLKDVSMTLGSRIKSVTGSSVSGNSALVVSGDTNVTFNIIEKVSDFRVLSSEETTVTKMTVGTLMLSDESVLRTLGKSRVSTLKTPSGTWYVPVDTVRNTKGIITSSTAKTTVDNDFAYVEGNGLKIVAVDSQKKTNITTTEISSKALTNNKIKLIEAKKLSTGIYRNGIYTQSVSVLNNSGDKTIKSSGNLVLSLNNANAYLVYDDRAVATENINGTVDEIDSRGTKQSYTVVLGENPGTLTKTPASKNASEIIFAGNNDIVVSSGTLLFGCDITLNRVNIAHTGSITLKNLTEQGEATLSATGDISVKNIVTDSGLEIKNTVYQKKSRITVSGTVTGDAPVIVSLYSNKAQTKPVTVGTTVDGIKWSSLVVNATGKADADSFRISAECLPVNCKYYGDNSGVNLENSYTLTKSGKTIKCIYSDEAEAILVKGANITGEIPSAADTSVIGLFGTINEALAEIKDSGGTYSVILLKDIPSTKLEFPKNAGKIIFVSAENADNRVYTIKLTNSLVTYSNTVLSNVCLGGKKAINIAVKSGNLEILGNVTMMDGSSYGKVTIYDGAKLTLHGGENDKTYAFSGVKGKGTLSIVSEGAEVKVKGDISTTEIAADSTEIDGSISIQNSVNSDKLTLNSGRITVKGNFNAANLIFLNSAEVIFGGETSLGNIISTENEGIISYKRRNSDKCLVSVDGKIEGKIRFNIMTDQSPEAFSVAYSDNHYSFKTTKRLLNFSGLYNKNDVEFSVNGENLDAADYVLISGKGMYYAFTEGFSNACNLTVLKDDSDAEMNFADASKASQYIDLLANSQGDYSIEVDYPCNFNTTSKEENGELIIPTKGNYNSLVIKTVADNPEEKIYRTSFIKGDGKVTFEDFGAIYVSESMNMSGELTLCNSNMVCFGKSAVEVLKLGTNSSYYAFGDAGIGSVLKYGSDVTNAFVGTMLSENSLDKTLLTIRDYWDEAVKCKAFANSSELIFDSEKTFAEINEMENTVVSGTCRDAGGVVYAKDISEMQIEITDGDGALLGYFANYTSAVKYIDNKKDKSGDYKIILHTSASIDGTIYMDGVTGHVKDLILPSYAKAVTITTAEGENTAYLAFKTGSFEFKEKYALILDRVNLLEEKENRSPSTGSLTIGGGTLVFTENAKTCKNGAFKTAVFCKEINCEKGTLVLENIALDSRGDVAIRNLQASGSFSITASGKTTITNIDGTGTVYLNRKSENNPEIKGLVAPSVKVGLIPYVKNSETGKYENASTEYIEAILTNGETSDAKKLLTCKNASENSFFICDSEKNPYIAGGKEVKLCKLSGSFYATTLEESVGLSGFNTDGILVYEGNFISFSGALKEITRLSKSACSYEITLSKNIGENSDGTISPISFSLPSKASKITFKGDNKAIFIKNDIISLKCDVVFDGVTPVYGTGNGGTWQAETGNIKLGNHSMKLVNISGKYYPDNSAGIFNASSYSISGESGSKLIIGLDRTNGAFTTIKKIKGISRVEIADINPTENVEKINIPSGVNCKTLVINGNVDMYTGSSNVSVADLSVTGTNENSAKLWAKNVEITSKLTVENAFVKAGTGTVGTGKFSVKNIEIIGENNEIDAKQDGEGKSLLTISGKTTHSNSQDNLKIGILYNNSASKYTQWYEGMRIFSGNKADLGMLTLRYTTDTEKGMGKAVDGYSLKIKSRKYAVISR